MEKKNRLVRDVLSEGVCDLAALGKLQCLFEPGWVIREYILKDSRYMAVIGWVDLALLTTQ